MQSYKRSQSALCAPSRTSNFSHATLGCYSVHRPHLRKSRNLRTTVSPISLSKFLQNVRSQTAAEPIAHKTKVSLATPDHSDFDSDCTSSDTESQPSSYESGGGTKSQLMKNLIRSIGDSDEDDLTELTTFRSQQEATVALAAASARRKVARAEHHLALCLAQEHDVLCALYRLQAEQSEKEVEEADHGIGGLRDSIRRTGFRLVSVMPRSSQQQALGTTPSTNRSTRKRKLD